MPATAQRVEIPSPGGAMPAWRHVPASTADGTPGVLVLSDAFGAAQHVHAAAERLAGEGFLALVPDLFYRDREPVLDYAEEERLVDRVMRTVALSDAAEERIKDDRMAETLRAALDAITADAGVHSGVGVLGFGIGGRLALLLACRERDRVAAVVSVSGARMLPLLGEIEALVAPLLLLFGGSDPAVPAPEIERIRAELQYRQKAHEIHTYEGAGSGFYCPGLAAYVAAAAEHAWSRALGWLRKSLV